MIYANFGFVSHKSLVSVDAIKRMERTFFKSPYSAKYIFCEVAPKKDRQ